MPYINAYQFAEASPRVYLTLTAMRADTNLPGTGDGPELAVTVTLGLYYWSGSSSAADTGTTVVQPTGTTGDGRWLRIVAAA